MSPIVSIFAACLLLGFDLATDSPVIEEDYAACGQISLFLICQLKGMDLEWESVKGLVGPPDEAGYHSFAALAAAADRLGMHAAGLQVDRRALAELPTPSIIQTRDWRGQTMRHLTVLLGTTRTGVYILDAPHSAVFYSWPEFESTWTGNVLVFTDTAREANQLRDYFSSWGRLRLGFWALTGLILCLVVVWLAFSVLSHRSRKPAGEAGFLARRRGAMLITGAVVLFIAVGSYLSYDKLTWLILGSSAHPRLVIENPNLDLGELPPGEHTVKIDLRNTGAKDLTIRQVDTSCSCAVPKAPERIPPGQNTALEIVLRVSAGREAARLILHANDPEETHVMRIQWVGIEEPKLAPAWIIGRGLSLSRPCERTIKLVYTGGKTPVVPEFKGFRCADAAVKVSAGRNNPQALQISTGPNPASVLGELELNVRIEPPKAPSHFETVCDVVVQQGKTEHVLRLPILLDFIGKVVPDADQIAFSGGHAR